MKQVVVIAGPSGVGKNAVIRALREGHPTWQLLVTATTRAARTGEENERDYFFFSGERFDQELSTGNIVGERFVPLFGGVHYGIYLPDLKKRLIGGGIVFAPVDITGAQYLKQNYNATTIFLTPQSITEIKGRIKMRNPDMSQAELDMRMKITENEIRSHAPLYDYTIVSADGGLSETKNQIMEILRKEGYNAA